MIDLFLREHVLLGLHADTLVGPVWAVRYDGTVSPRGWYDDKGRSLDGPLRARPVALARVTSGYGSRHHPITGTETRHTGVDYGADIGTPVLAVGDGTVREASSSKTAGTFLKLTHADGWESWYLHLNDIAVKKGDTVKQGNLIAHTGNTGASTGPHLHFELRIINIALDPRRTVPVPTLALSPRELPRHAANIRELKETQ